MAPLISAYALMVTFLLFEVVGLYVVQRIGCIEYPYSLIGVQHQQVLIPTYRPGLPMLWQSPHRRRCRGQCVQWVVV